MTFAEEEFRYRYRKGESGKKSQREEDILMYTKKKERRRRLID